MRPDRIDRNPLNYLCDAPFSARADRPDRPTDRPNRIRPLTPSKPRHRLPRPPTISPPIIATPPLTRLFPPRPSNPSLPPSSPPIAPSRCLHFIPAPVFPSSHSSTDAPVAWLLFCRFPCPSFRFLFVFVF